MGSIEKIHEMLVSKECSCTELTKSYLDEINANIFITFVFSKRKKEEIPCYRYFLK